MTTSKELPQAIWDQMRDLVLDDDRRREVERATGLSFWRARSLRRIAQGDLRMSDLARVIGVSAPQATVLVDVLEERGLVRRIVDPRDARVKIVRTTAKGRRVADTISAVLRRPPDTMASLTTTERRTLLELLHRLSPES
ncbi:MAG: MarR family transcriptional regulator [Acidobacteria bacterium]|nr:MarR family transcriptional regulator [Acidobacteriota bacterium]